MPHSPKEIWSQQRNSSAEDGGPAAGLLGRIVDAGLVAIVCVAPFVFGGRHDMGRLVLVALVMVTAGAWFLRQALVGSATWMRTTAHVVLLLSVALVVLQLVPLPASWIVQLAPRTAELLPVWSPASPPGNLGPWRTLSLTPHDTTIALAMLISYCLLFVVVTQRVQSVADVWRILSWIGAAAVLMAAFGLVQYFASNGRFLWFYEHPFRTTDDYVKGSFINRNHFANFLVLGVGPLVALLLAAVRRCGPQASRHKAANTRSAQLHATALLAGAIVVVIAVLLSLSRGGAMALSTSLLVLGGIYWRWRFVDAKAAGGAIGLIVVVFGLLSIYGYDKVAGRLDDFTAGSLDTMDGEGSRRTIWVANLAAFREGWLVGAGAGSHREIYPVYIKKSLPREYTHAENGYLQIATEMGIGGVALLVAAMGLCGWWCLECLRRLESVDERLCFGAVAAGLAASATHSLVDFVWYIPACTTLTIVLAACLLRLAQFRAPPECRVANRLPPTRWLELSAICVLAGTWCTYTLFGPAMASVYWDRYLRASADNTRIATEQLAATLGQGAAVDSALAKPLSDAMLRHLEDAARWDPACARVQLRLAGKCLERFELLQQDAANAMPLSQIRAAALASKFSSPVQLRAWLDRAVGKNAGWLYRALDHAKAAIALCPLQGEAYARIAELSFLEGTPPSAAEAFIAQAERVRPYDGDVLFEIGMHKLLENDPGSALSYWARCFRDRGDHQPRIVQLLAGRQIPAAMFLEIFQPDWRTLRDLWSRYRQSGTEQDLSDLLAYAADVTERQVRERSGIPPACIWFWQASMYTDVGRSNDAILCLEQSYGLDPHFYQGRLALARALLHTRRFAEAEPHIRWCLARQPENKFLKVSLLEISKQRFSERDAMASGGR